MRQKYQRVSVEQRCQIMALLRTKIRVREISRQLGLHRATVYREIKRNQCSRGFYSARFAQTLASWRRKSCRKGRCLEAVGLYELVARGLRSGLSPELIAGRTGRVSHQTIYNELKSHHPELRGYLPRYGKRRGRGRQGRRPSHGKTKTADFLRIQDRPASANTRSRLGHWERDTMFVKDREMVLVVQERKSRYVRLEKINKHSYQDVPAQTRRLVQVGRQTPRSITNDNGTEFMEPTRVGVPVYFCDPYSPQQRGSIENVIGQIRRYLPRSMDFNDISDQVLRDIENRLNYRPKKCLGYLTPHEVIFKTRVALAI